MGKYFHNKITVQMQPQVIWFGLLWMNTKSINICINRSFPISKGIIKTAGSFLQEYYHHFIENNVRLLAVVAVEFQAFLFSSIQFSCWLSAVYLVKAVSLLYSKYPLI